MLLALLLAMPPTSRTIDPVEPPPIVAPRPPLPPGATPPRPIGDPAMWVTTDDYPPVALREEWEGVSEITLEVGSDGAVQGCIVTSSSGHGPLDGASCARLFQRARFVPAKVRGRAVESTYSTRIRWQLPQVVPFTFVTGRVIGHYMITPDGALAGCNEESSGAPMASMRGICDAADRTSMLTALVGEPLASFDSVSVGLGLAAGRDGWSISSDEHFVRVEGRFIVEQDGRIASCTVTPWDSGTGLSRLFNVCDTAFGARGRFVAGQPGVERSGTLLITVDAHRRRAAQ